MSGFHTILHKGDYSPGVSGTGDRPEVVPVVPIRAEQAGEVTAVSVLGSFTGGMGLPQAVGSEPQAAVEVVEEGGAVEIDMDTLLADAAERGRREAREELAEAIRGYETSKTKLEEMVQAIDSCREGWGQQLRQSTGELLLQALERMVSEVPALLDEHLRKGCQLAVESMMSVQQVDIIVHPDDAELAEDLIGQREGWAVLTDDSIRGGCMVEAPSGRLDASLDAALEAISGSIEAWKQETAPQDEAGT